MPELDLKPIKKRAEVATPGPWTVKLFHPGVLSGVFYSGKEEIFTPGTKLPKSICRNPQFSKNQDIRSDMEFIAHARTDIPALIEEVERLRKLTEWQPIETAPKNGTPILVYYCGDPLVADWDEEEEKWVDFRTSQCCFSQPTHWMPLPQPPGVTS